jgi:hypothetical protein
MATEIKPISDEEFAIINEGPAPYANRFFISVGPVVRLTFGEQDNKGKNLKFRSAVALPHQQAIELKDILGQLLADIERQLNEAKAAAPSPPKQEAGEGIVKRR